MILEYDVFVRKPFVVEAVLVTEENLEEVAKYVGTVDETADGQRFIKVDRKKVPHIPRVFPGWYMTRLNNNTHCYSEKVFAEQFLAINYEIQAWVNYMNEPRETDVVANENEVIVEEEVLMDTPDGDFASSIDNGSPAHEVVPLEVEIPAGDISAEQDVAEEDPLLHAIDDPCVACGAHNVYHYDVQNIDICGTCNEIQPVKRNVFGSGQDPNA